MPSSTNTLSLLAYPLTKQLHGAAYVYEFPDRVNNVWDELLARYREATESRGNLPYAGLATALRAVCRTSVNLSPTSKDSPPQRIISRQPLNRDDIHDAVTVWQQALLNVGEDEISFSYPSELADLLAGITPDPVVLADHVKLVGGQPDAPNWVYDAASWEIAHRLANTSLSIDNTEIRFRNDTAGNLLVWDNDLLWSSRWNSDNPDEQPCYAALRIQLQMKTLPWTQTPVVVVDPSVSRLTRWINSSRTAWLAPRGDGDPLLCLALQGNGPRTRIEPTSDIALTVWSRLRGERLLEPQDRDLTGPPGRLRALVPKSVRFPIGRGVGMHTVRELSAHFSAILDLPSHSAEAVAGHQFPKRARRRLDAGRDTDLLDDTTLPTILDAAGCQHLRILALYHEQHTRARMQRLLAYHFNRPDLADIGVPEAQTVQLAERVEVVFAYARDFLAHGEHGERANLVRDLAGIDAPDGTRITALCETDYNEKSWAQQRKESRKAGSSVTDPYQIDAKPAVSRLLAEHGILAQFLATRPATTTAVNSEQIPRPDITKDSDAENDSETEESDADPLNRLGESLRKDHRGHNAIADLLRLTGLIHPRLTTALTHGQHGLTETTAFVGLHVREQRGRRGRNQQRRLSWSLVALIPDGDHWHAKAYQAKRHPTGGGTGWRDYFTANTSFRSHSLSEGTRQDSGFVDSIDIALDQLQQHLPTQTAYVVLASGDTRALWPMLANKNLDRVPDATGGLDGRPALPGYGPSCGHRPAAVIRVTSGSRDLPRPVALHKTKTTAFAETRMTMTTEGLFKLNDADRTWILSNIPRQFSGGRIHSRAGLHSSRWNADLDENRHTWYAHTTTEILVLGTDDDQALRYAVATARLCDNAIAWDGRTQYPAPVHLAMQMDKDHPDYRRTTNIDDEIDMDELLELNIDGDAGDSA